MAGLPLATTGGMVTRATRGTIGAGAVYTTLIGDGVSVGVDTLIIQVLYLHITITITIRLTMVIHTIITALSLHAPYTLPIRAADLHIYREVTTTLLSRV